MKITFRHSKRRLAKTALILCLGALAALLVAELEIRHAAHGRVYADTETIPARATGLVLGCGKTLKGGRANLYFTHRVEAAAALYHNGKISRLIVSGDNHAKNYDEATDMRDALIARGVPAERIHCDFAGFRTLDSVIRAKEIFGQTQLTVISQPFHNRRAIFIARAKGIDAIGYNAAEVTLRYGLRTRLRESLACIKALLDITIGTAPRFLGPPIDINTPAKDFYFMRIKRQHRSAVV